jgi:hypothetical protein
MQKVELAEAIEQLRDQLELAMKTAEDKALRFRLGPVELQLKVELAQKATAVGRVKAWVIEAGADGSLNANSAHTVKIVLHPQKKNDKGEYGDLQVGARPGFNPMSDD